MNLKLPLISSIIVDHGLMAECYKVEAAQKKFSRQDKLLHTINSIAEMLLVSESANAGETIVNAMGLLAECAGADRMYIWQNRIINEQPSYEQQFEWLGDLGAKKTLFKTFGTRYIDAIPAWEESFSENLCINGPLSSRSQREQEFFSRFNLCSIIAIPIFLNNSFWGFVTFDNCHEEVTVPEDTIIILKSGSLLLANTIVQHLNQIEIGTRIAQQELMSIITRNFISQDHIDSLINDAIGRMGAFMDVSRTVVVVRDDKETGKMKPLYEWTSSHEWVMNTPDEGFSESVLSTFPEVIPSSDLATVLWCNSVVNDFNGKYVLFSKTDVKSFIWAPVYVDCNLWGIVSIEECRRHREWDESDVQLAGIVSSAISGAVERNLIDEARTAALEQALQASKAKGYFLSNMSHEIRTPMNAITGMTTIGKNANDIEKKDYAFSKIESASTHLLGVINEILDMSKIEANKLELSPVSFEFEKMLQKVANVITFKADEKKQSFYINIDSRIPDTLTGDDQRLAQVIANLLSNAVKFTPEEGHIHLNSIFVEEADGICTLKIEVRDTGIGLTESQKARLFRAYEQAENSTSRKFGGTGLGLAISKRIVEMMDGTIWVESEPEKGSTFAFTIKMEKGEPKVESVLSPEVNWNNVKILAVDDEQEILEFFSGISDRFGLDIDTAVSADEALELIKTKGGYDIYFIDQRMPGMSGVELAKRIREIQKEKAVIALVSGYDWSSIEKEAKAAGVNKFISKPLFPSTVADFVNESLGVAEKHEEAADDIPDYKNCTMLLAEDIEINREIIMTMLEPTNITIDCAENGAQAVNMFTADPAKYDLIFMDIQMPEMDGYEASQCIRAMDTPEAKSIPIVAMTANVFKEDIEKCLAAGMGSHLGKPLDFGEVMNVLKKYLHTRRNQPPQN